MNKVYWGIAALLLTGFIFGFIFGYVVGIKSKEKRLT